MIFLGRQIRWTAIAALLPAVLLVAAAPAAWETVEEAAANLKTIEVSFKLDPRLTRSMYMGERWISPPTYSGVQQQDGELVVHARAMGYDHQGRPVNINPTWQAGDAAVVQVAPAQGREVQLRMLKEGQSDLTVKFGKITRRLTIKAVQYDNALRVDITQ